MLSKEQFEQDIQLIVKRTNKNEKLAWSRKAKKMKELIGKLQPIEDQILTLVSQKEPILDEISDLRKTMIKGCVHPEDMLVHHGKVVECKFCNVKIAINRSWISEEHGS